VHYADASAPHEPPADGPEDFTHGQPALVDITGKAAGARGRSVVDSLEMIDRYDEQVAYVDREVGRFLRIYRQLGHADDAMVIFCADHGQSLMEHDQGFAPGQCVYNQVVRVPLAIRYKTLPPGRKTVPVSLVDLPPTILAAAGLPAPSRSDGQSLLGTLALRDLFAESRGRFNKPGTGEDAIEFQRCVIRGDRKIVATLGASGSIQEALAFDLREDPGELLPMPISEPDPLLQSLSDFIAADSNYAGLPEGIAWSDCPGVNVAPTADPRLLEQLASLGYADMTEAAQAKSAVTK
jgi:arylsulfatase A-like enzyme